MSDRPSRAFTDLWAGAYSVIVADPPWPFRTWSETNQGRAASNHYGLMKLDEICALPVADLAARDCALFLWAVNPMLPEAMRVIDAWGFRFKTVAFTWVKLNPRAPSLFLDRRSFHMGMGYWSRQNTEQCIIATRGKPKRVGKGVRQLVVTPRREHSRKPDEVYERIEALLPGPYAELFARTERPGWDCWGNEIGRFEARAPDG